MVLLFGDRLMVRPLGEISSAKGETDRTTMFYVYILSSLEYKKSYVGCTDCLERRLTEHNSGKMAFTKRYKPWGLIYHEEFGTLREARKRERYLKTSAGRRFLKKILNSF